MNYLSLDELYSGLLTKRKEIKKISDNQLDILDLNFSYPSDLIQNKPEIYKEVFLNVDINKFELEGLKGEWIIHKEADVDKRLLYIHGGAFMFGSIDEYRHLCALLSKYSKCAVLLIEYRLAPKYPYPVALNDTIMFYLWMIKHNNKGQKDAVKAYVCGDSAGGTLTLALIFKLLESQERIPDAVVTLCASVDETRHHKSWLTNCSTDIILGDFAKMLVKDKGQHSVYLNGHSTIDKFVSPLFGDFEKFPPILIQVSSSECMRDDSLALYHKICEAGGDAILDIYKDLPHVWQLYAPLLEESVSALQKIGEYIFHK